MPEDRVLADHLADEHVQRACVGGVGAEGLLDRDPAARGKADLGERADGVGEERVGQGEVDDGETGASSAKVPPMTSRNTTIAAAACRP